MRDALRDALIAWLWPALYPLVVAVARDIVADQPAPPPPPARRYMGSRRDG